MPSALGLVLRKDGRVVLFSSHHVETAESVVTYMSFCFFVCVLCLWQYGVPGHRAITPCCGQVREKGVDSLVNVEEGSRVSHGGC